MTIATTHIRSIVDKLDDAMRRKGITNVAAAAALGVRPETISTWRNGQLYPRYPALLAWAKHLGMRVVVVDETRRVLAEGADIPTQLRCLREQAGLTHAQVAHRLSVHRGNIAHRENTRRRWHLSSRILAEHIAALGYTLTLATARAATRHQFTPHLKETL